MAVLLIFCLGTTMVFNITSAETIHKEGILYVSAVKQFLFFIFGCLMGWGVYRFGYSRLICYSPWLFWSLIVLLVFVFFPKIGVYTNGAHRWIKLFGISLQPSEFMKIALPLYYLRKNSFFKGEGTFKQFFLQQPLWFLPIFLIMIEPDNGTAVVLLATLVVLYFLTEVKWYYWIVPILVMFFLGIVVAFSMKHVSDRMYSYFHPEEDLLGKGHQPYQAKIATGSGGLLGRGLGESLQKLHYLPEAKNDYIAAIYAEEFGFLGIFFLIILYLSIAVVCFRISFLAKDIKGYYLGTVLTFVMSLQVFLNLGVVSGLLPSKGSSLPFFSQGGSSLLANMLIVAILMSIEME